MTETKIMTTRQKRTLEKIFKCLDIDIKALIEIQNIPALKKENEILSNANADLLELVNNLNTRISLLESQVADLIAKQQKSLIEQIWGNQEVDDNEKERTEQ